MKYNFDQMVERKGTQSIKWEFRPMGKARVMQPTDEFLTENPLLPMWVADMDFPVPQPVIEALQARVGKGIFGYTSPTDSYYAAIINWMKKRHQWEIEKEWICSTPCGVVSVLHLLVQTFTSPQDKILIQPPVYHPFFAAIRNNGRELVTNPLRYQNGQYSMDFDDLAQKTRDPSVKMVILCSPHNPVGRVWTEEELTRFGEICLKNDVLVVSDEIHGDLIFKGHRFTPLARLHAPFAQNVVVCTATSKTFNMAGLHTSNILIPNPRLRESFQHTLKKNGTHGLNSFGVVAVETAYNEGEEWLSQVLEYIESNLAFMEDYLQQHIPPITLVRPQGTYLVWLDCQQLGLNQEALQHLMLEKARIYFDEGHIFGAGGEGFERMNIACPRSILKEALHRMKTAIALQ